MATGDAYKALLKGIQELDLQHSSVPCNLVLTGDAFPLVINSHGHILLAASVYGGGRIVVLSHETYLTLCPALVENALTWLGGEKSTNLSLGVQKKMKAVADNLSSSSYKVSLVEEFSKDLGVDVYITDAYEVGTKAGDLVTFMKAGGGILIGGQALSWASQNPKENLILQFPGNKVTAVAGIYFSAQSGGAEKILTVFLLHRSRMDFKEDLEFLLQGISNFSIRPRNLFPCAALVHGPLSFSICATDDGETFLAGSYYGRGRIILVTHQIFLERENMASFWKNAYDWLDQGRKGVVGFEPGVKPLPNLGLTCKTTQLNQDLSVFVCTAYTGTEAQMIQNFVVEGGGLVIGGEAADWASKNTGQNPMQDFSGNKILNKMGLSLLRKTVQKGEYKAPDPSQVKEFHIRDLLHRFAGHVLEGRELNKEDEEHLEKLGKDLASFLNMKAITTPLSYTRSFYKISNINKENKLFIVYLSIILTLTFLFCMTAHSGWISTGLYLSPGMKTDVVLPPKLIQIGCHSDHLKKKVLVRAPYVIKRFPVTSERMKVWNLWGGLIYLMAPRNIKLEEEQEIVVEEAVAAPYYKSGVTTAADWSSVRQAPAPWAEIEFDNVIFTVPSGRIRQLEIPLEAEKLWNDIMKAVADLAVIPQKFTPKERFVVDVQISIGFLHSGYPIMMMPSAGAQLFKPDGAWTKGLWGEIHELGHNQQRSPWEFPSHTSEATCNLWSVYVHEEVLGLGRAEVCRSLKPQKRKDRIEKYIEEGRNLSSWSVWVALETYLQLQEKFGWAVFKQVFAQYHDMTNVPRDKEGKMNLYAETFSKAADMNLSGFFKAWGWPIKPATEEKLSNLPAWTDHPLAQYA
uniref:TRPM8 channel-associated factor homolog n=1 Tax=Cyprinodon variegatus TaxID=28743 RepID=A0A3Q2G1L0_CYPVA